MSVLLRLFLRDLVEVTQRRGMLGLVLAAPIALLLLIGHLNVSDPLIRVAVIETDVEEARLPSLRRALGNLNHVEVIVWQPEAASAQERMLRHRVDAVAEWAGADWRFTAPTASRHRGLHVQEVVQDLALSMHREAKLTAQLQAMAALREAIGTASAPASAAAGKAPAPALEQLDAFERGLRDEAELPTPLVRAWLASRLQTQYARATPSDHSLVPSYIALISVFLPFLFGATALVREREAGTLPTLMLVTQGRWRLIALGKLLLPLFVAMLTLILLLVVAHSAFGYGIKPGLLSGISVQLAAALVSALLGLSLSTLVQSAQDAYTASAVYLVASILLTGLIYPVDQAAPTVSMIAHTFPLTLSGPPLDAWMTQGSGARVMPEVWIGLGVQALAAAVLCAFSLRRLQERL